MTTTRICDEIQAHEADADCPAADRDLLHRHLRAGRGRMDRPAGLGRQTERVRSWLAASVRPALSGVPKGP